MNMDELFIDSHKLPEQLSQEELSNMIQQFKDGSKEARNKIITHNIRLVLSEVLCRFSSVNYDKKELVSIGVVGLVNAVDNYDMSKGYRFSSYAVKCIDNEILMFLRKLKKYNKVDSLDKIVSYKKDGGEIRLEDLICDNTDLVEENETVEVHEIIRETVKDLPERDREVIRLAFGFYNNKIYNKTQIADKMNISQSYVSRLIVRILKKIGKILKSKGVVELPSSQLELPKERKKEMAKLKTIYEYFKDYTKEQVDEMLTKLTEEEKSLIRVRYGEDLNNPVPTKLTKKQMDKFYGSLVPKMKRLLSNPLGKKRSRQRNDIIQQQLIVEQIESTNREPAYDDKTSNESLEFEGKTTQVSPIAIQEKVEQPTNNKEEITKEECIKILELLRTPTFAQMMSTLSVKEAVIIALKLGYIDGKCFSVESISEFLGIESEEVTEITKKVLLSYKENINNFLDKSIVIATDEVVKNKILLKK